MLDDKGCSDPDELRLMLLGRLSAADSAAIEDHLDRCSRCLTLVGEMEIESQIVDVLKAQPAANTVAVPAELDHLMTTLDALHPGFGLCSDGRSTPGRSAHDREDVPVLARSDSPEELGRLAHFRILERIGSGGMGVVYRAKDTKLQRPVALKVLRPRTAQDPDARACFLREARAIASIKHDHVVVVHDVGEAAASEGDVTTPYLAMELLDGVSLQMWMEANPRPPLLTIVRLGRQIAEALAALHARGLVHRDVKPGNLWLEQPRSAEAQGADGGLPSGLPIQRSEIGKLKLLDFGLASNSSEAVAEARALGTPAYMAPEQFRGDAVDPRSDLFGLGCVLYELCTREHPFPDRRFCVEHTVPFPASDVNPDVPPAFADLVAQMLRENPDARPESSRRVIRELSLIEESLAAADAGASLGTSATPPARSRFRRVALIASIAGASLAVLAVVAVALHSFRLASPPDGLAKKSPIEEAWYAEIRKLPTRSQFRAVTAKLEELNPGYTSKKVAGWFEPEAVIRFSERTDHLHDIRPLGCLIDLKTVTLKGEEPTTGQLTDLTPLRSLRLHNLVVSGNPQLRDLSPLKGMPIFYLDVSNTGVVSLADLAASPLQELRMANAPVADLDPVRSLPQLRLLDCRGCPIASLEPLAGSSVEQLMLDYRPARDARVLKSLASLRKINDMDIEAFWRKHSSLSP
jgi:eukaryotic-like serine/threonine-protein kinase